MRPCDHTTLVRAKTGGWFCVDRTGCEFAVPEPRPAPLASNERNLSAAEALLTDACEELHNHQFSADGSYNNDQVINLIERIDAYFRGDVPLKVGGAAETAVASKSVSLKDFIEIMSEPVEVTSSMRQYIIDALTDLAERRAAETRDEPFANKLRARIEEMRGALYTYGNYGEPVGGPILDGVLDAIEELSAEKTVEPSPLTLLDFGYAPGSYFCGCVTCEQQFIGDKRAIRCEPCASKKLAQLQVKTGVNRTAEYMRNNPPPSPDPYSDLPVETV